MQAQLMKDEFEGGHPESASQKSVTDWLMHVISGKQEPETRLRAVTSDTVLPLPVANGLNTAQGLHPVEEAVAEPVEPWTGIFTANDLCGAPLIPMPEPEGPVDSANEITADDVCWVPEERRLKPQPTVVVAPVGAHAAEPVIALPAGIADWNANGLSAVDITREPAPYFEPQSTVSQTEDREITAADISRQWVIDEIEYDTAQKRAAEELSASATTIEAEPEVIPAIAVEPQAKAAVVEPEEAVSAPEVVTRAPEAVSEAAVAEEEPEMPVAPATAAGFAETTEADQTDIDHGGAMEAAEADWTEVDHGKTTETAGAEPAAWTSPGEIADERDADEQHVAAVQDADSHAEKVWAREGYWNAETHPAVAKAAQPAIEGEIEAQHGAATLHAARGYLRSYLGPEEIEEIEKAKPEGWSTAWRTLIRLGAALPWLSRALPALEAGLVNNPGAAAGSEMASGGTPQGMASGVAAEVQQDVAGIRLVQYEIRTTVQDHSAQLKRMEEQLSRVRESMDSRADSELAEDVKAAMKLLKMVGVGLGALLAVLIVLALMMVMKH